MYNCFVLVSSSVFLKLEKLVVSI